MIRIALTNLGQYNEGILNFKWIDLPIDDEDLEEAMEEIDIGKEDEFGIPYEEYFISDYETDIAGLKIGDYTNLEMLNEYAQETEDLSEDDKLALQAYLESGCDFDYSLEKALNGSYQVWTDCEDMTDVAMRCVEDGLLGAIPEKLQNYIDYEAYGNDLECSGSFYAETDKKGSTHMVELLD